MERESPGLRLRAPPHERLKLPHGTASLITLTSKTSSGRSPTFCTVTEALVEQTAVTLDPRGRVQATQYATADAGVFVAGDAQRGASLVVWALTEGREAAQAVDVYLRGDSPLPLKGEGDLPRA